MQKENVHYINIQLYLKKIYRKVVPRIKKWKVGNMVTNFFFLIYDRNLI